MNLTARDVLNAFAAAGVSAEFRGDPETSCETISSLEEVRPASLIFAEKSKDVPAAIRSEASTVVVPLSDLGDLVPSARRAIIGVKDIRWALPVLLTLFDRRPSQKEGVHPTAVIGSRVTLGKGVAIGPYAVVGNDGQIGDGAVIESHVSIGPGCVVGSQTRIFSGVRIYDGVRIGERCRIHCGTVIGSDGYGYVSTPEGHRKIPQIGAVRIEDDVELGANVTIDRGAIGDTVIGRGTKIDNLVHLAHNVRVGDHSLIIAQSGVAGSARLGKWVVLAAQSGVAGHISVGDRTMIGGKSGVTKSVTPGQMISGFPARPHGEEKRIKVSMGRLPAMVSDVHRLKAAVLRLSKRLSAVERASAAECV